jgi:predicted ATPase
LRGCPPEVTLQAMTGTGGIHTPDRRLRVFVSSTLGELADERLAVRGAIERLHLSPVMFELGARPHPPRQLYRAYLEQSDVFIGIYWQRYGWVAPGEAVSGLEDEYRLAGARPQLIYLKEPAPDREPRLRALLDDIRDNDRASYRRFSTPDELARLVGDDLAVLLSERFMASAADRDASPRRTTPAPVPLTPTFGRDDDVAAVARMLADGERLVTLTGAGGTGKTRLALEVARAVAAGYPGGVHHVPLAAVTDPSLVLPTVADHAGVSLEADVGVDDAIVAHFAGVRALLLLDNLEQVIAVRSDLADLLGRAPDLQVLATSRQALRIAGEREVPVGPLPVPATGDPFDVLAATASVRMFIDRARARDGTFALTPDNVDLVAELCRRVDGLPLALELAAAHLRLFGPSGLLERLRRPLDLPATGLDLPARQQTLRATLDYSHELLDGPQRRLFARMAVFADGATLDAITDVCADDGEDLLEPLAGLLDHNLLRARADGGATEPRLRMLTPVREYALERLEARGETDLMRQRHLDHYRRLGRAAQPYLCGPRQRDWAARWDAERADVRAAVATAFDTGAVDTVLRLVWDSVVYYYIRDAVEEPRAWITRVAAHRDALDEAERAMLDVGLAIVGTPRADRPPEPVLRDAATVLERHGLELETAVAWHYLGLHRWHADDIAGAIEALRESSERYAAIAHDWGAAAVETTRGAVQAALGEADRAIAHYRRSLVHCRAIDNRHQIAQALQGIALIAAREGRVDEATEAFDEARDLVMAARSVTGASYLLEAQAAIAMARGDADDAICALAAARSARARLGIPAWTAAADAAAPVLAQARAAVSPEHFEDRCQAGEEADPFTLLAVDPVAPSAGSG